MLRLLLATSTIVAAFSAVPAAAVTTVVTFTGASCSTACANGSFISQNNGDTANIDVGYRATSAVGNAATAETSLRYWQNSYSNSEAAYSQSSFGEVRFDTLTAGTLTLDSVDFGGWPNAVRNIQYRVYDLSYTLLTSGSLDTNALALSTVAFGQNSTSGLIFQYGQDGFNGGIQNVTFSFASGNVPEPASWAMLIAGFGLTGAAMRRRQASTLRRAVTA